MKQAIKQLEYVLVIFIAIAISLIAIYFHDLNTLNECNKQGFTDNLVTGRRIHCLEMEP